MRPQHIHKNITGGNNRIPNIMRSLAHPTVQREAQKKNAICELKCSMLTTWHIFGLHPVPFSISQNVDYNWCFSTKEDEIYHCIAFCIFLLSKHILCWLCSLCLRARVQWNPFSRAITMPINDCVWIHFNLFKNIVVIQYLYSVSHVLTILIVNARLCKMKTLARSNGKRCSVPLLRSEYNAVSLDIYFMAVDNLRILFAARSGLSWANRNRRHMCSIAIWWY